MKLETVYELGGIRIGSKIEINKERQEKTTIL